MSKKNQEIVLKATNLICDAIKCTLGNKGRTVLYNTFLDEKNQPRTSKDGATIAKQIRSEDDYENLVVSIIREGSLKTMLSVGDGTTTTAIIAQYIIQKGMQLLDAGISYYEMSKGIDEAVKNIIAYVEKNAIQIEDNKDILLDIASTSANSEETGRFLYDIIKEIGIYGNIEVKRSMHSKTRLETIKGFKSYKGWFEPFMCNNLEKETFEADNAKVLVIDGEVRDWNVFIEYWQAFNTKDVSTPFVIFCDSISNSFWPKLKNFIGVSKEPICFVENDGWNERREMIREDIACYTGGRVVSNATAFDIDNLGSCGSIIVGKENTSIIDGEFYIEDVAERVEDIKRIIQSDRLSDNTELSNMEKLFYQRRLANFTGGISVIKAGGKTEVEMNELKDRLDDAVEAVQSAVRGGACLGGGYTFLNCKKQLLKEQHLVKNNIQSYLMVLDAIEEPFIQLLRNSYLFMRYNEIKENILNEKPFDLRNILFPLPASIIFMTLLKY